MEKRNAIEVTPKVRPVAYIIGLMFVVLWQVIGTFLTGFTAGQTLNPFGKNDPVVGMFFTMGYACVIQYVFLLPFIATILSVLLRRIKILDLSRHELAVIYAMLWVTFLIPCYYGITPMYTYWPGALTDAIYGPFAKRILTSGDFSYFAPNPNNEAIWKAFWWAGPVDWAAWTPVILFNTTYIFILYFLFLMIATLFRRVMVDVEGLPFPWATAGAELINISTSTAPEKPSLFKNKFIWAGLGLGLVSTANYWLPSITTVPWTPRILGYDLTPLGILPWVPLEFNFDPWMIAAAFLVPKEWILSFVLWSFILYWIVPPILKNVGLYGTMPLGTAAATAYDTLGGKGDSVWKAGLGQLASTGAYGAIYSGAILSVALWPLFTVQREHIANSIKALWKKHPEEEKDEPMSYRWIWIGIIIGVLAYAGIVTFSSKSAAPFWWGIIYIGWFTFWVILPRARMQGTLTLGSGMEGWDICWIGHVQIYGHWWFCSPASPACPGQITGLEDPLTIPRALGTYHVTWTIQYPFVSNGIPITTGLDAFKIGRLTNTHSRYIFFAMVLGILVAVPLTGVLFLNWVHMYGGLDRFSGVSLKDWPVRQSYNASLGAANGWWPWYRQNNTGVVTWQYHIFEIAGLILGIILWIVAARYPWVPLHPIGFAGTILSKPVGWLWPALVAYVVKTVVLRIGGASLYERKGIPFAIGMVLAFSITYLLCGFSGAYKILTK